MDCGRCGEPAVTKTRGEHFCQNCFISFLNIKFRKHLDKFRVNFMNPDQPTLLCSVSFGAGSLCLADMLGQLLSHQREKHGGRTGFKVLCVYIGDETHDWPFQSSDLQLKRVSLEKYYAKAIKVDEEPLVDAKIAKKLSRTSRQDLETRLRAELLEDIRIQENCARTLSGASMTRLSELVVSETVKGRGAGIPRLMDGDILYPLKDILDAEILKYLEFRNLTGSIAAAPAVPKVTKMQSIDELVHIYFQGVQKEFPAVVSTVAKTASKLAQDAEPCNICGKSEDETTVCYGCRVMMSNKNNHYKLSKDRTAEILREFEL